MSELQEPTAMERQPFTPSEWAAWLTKREENTWSVYLRKPELLIADYIRERESTRDYEGREILELLQNANDAAADIGEKSRVVIELYPEELIVANTGALFSTDGVVSLQTSNLSPKRFNRRLFIGNKGLGFRAVLNWSRTPIILSNSLRIAYSRTDAQRKLARIMGESPELTSLVRKESVDDTDLVLPLLLFPSYREDGDLASAVDNDAARKILSRCEHLQGDGFTTVIGMPFDRSKAFEHAQQEIAGLRPELLLFVQNLEEIVICEEEGKPVRQWRCEDLEGGARVYTAEDTFAEWAVYREEGQIPQAFIDADGGQRRDYEIIIAIPRLSLSEPLPLFSYFPTEISLPLSIVCHATLELEQNRKHAQGGEANRFVLCRLAQFLAEVAERRAASDTDNLWAGCEMLIPRGDFTSDLVRAGFYDHLIKAAREKAIVPTLGGQRVIPRQARHLEGASRAWLPRAEFSDVVALRDPREKSFFEALGVPVLTKEEIREHLTRLHNLAISQRAALIAGMVQHNISKDLHTPSLLLDSDGNLVPPDSRVFLAPSSGVSFSMPAWAEIRFLNEQLREELGRRLNSRDARDLQGQLASFRVVEYSLDNLISGLVATTHRHIKESPEKTEEFETELLRTLFALFPSDLPSERRPKFPDESSVRVPTQAGRFEDARRVHLGAGYPPYGTIIQELFGSWAPEKLVATSEILGLAGDVERVRQFLFWLGVTEWPREVFEKNPNRDFRSFVLQRISYPARFEEKIYNTPSEVEGSSLVSVKSIDGLSSILEHADPFAVLAWLASDDRAAHWQRMDKGHATLRSLPSRAQNYRNFSGSLPSYIHWTFQHTPWFPLNNGTKSKPRDCLVGERAIESIFPRPQLPSPEVLEKYGISPAQIRDAWSRAGVMPGLAYLDREEIYQMLLDLPQRSSDGQAAKALYRWLVDTADSVMGAMGRSYQEFLKRGQMWGRWGNKQGYFLVKELRHTDSEGFPDVLLNKLRLVDLPKRIGADKVEKLFGVQPIGKAKIEQRLKHRHLAVGASQVCADFEAAKPYLYKLRQSQTTQTQHLRAFKQLKLEVCSEVVAVIQYEEDSFDFELPVWDWLIIDDTLYIRADPTEQVSLSSDLLADAIGAALASLFRIGEGGRFARMLLCKEKDRPSLLRRMRGEGSDEDIETLKAEFAAATVEKGHVLHVPVTPETASTRPLPTGANQPPPTERTSFDTEQQPRNKGEIKKPVSEKLTITEKSHTPAPTPRRTELRIRAVSQPALHAVSQYRVNADGDFCEQKAMEFECEDDPPRSPLLVKHIVGYKAPGCDILSFATAEDRDAFLAAEEKDAGLVQRFIEVKARSEAKARIELKGNELTAAEQYQDRYFLYRFFETEEEEFILAILQNPLSSKEAILPVIEVNLERAQGTRVFRLSGGLSKQGNPESQELQAQTTDLASRTSNEAQT